MAMEKDLKEKLGCAKFIMYALEGGRSQSPYENVRCGKGDDVLFDPIFFIILYWK